MIASLDNVEKEIKTHIFDRIDESRPKLSLGKGATLGDDTPTIKGTQIDDLSQGLYKVCKFHLWNLFMQPLL